MARPKKDKQTRRINILIAKNVSKEKNRTDFIKEGLTCRLF